MFTTPPWATIAAASAITDSTGIGPTSAPPGSSVSLGLPQRDDTLITVIDAVGACGVADLPVPSAVPPPAYAGTGPQPEKGPSGWTRTPWPGTRTGDTSTFSGRLICQAGLPSSSRYADSVTGWPAVALLCTSAS
jgi:hypothetical protein